MAGAALLMIPLALPLRDRPAPEMAGHRGRRRRRGQALSRAFRTPTFWYLFFGFFVCGLHVSFLTVHLPGFVPAAACRRWWAPAHLR